MPICTQGMQRTWWPEAGTIIVTGPYYQELSEYIVCGCVISVLPLSWWRHQMETFSALLAICAEKSPVTGEFPAQRPVTQSFDVFFICARTNGWVNNCEAGDLRHHRAHYDVTVMRFEETFQKSDMTWLGKTVIWVFYCWGWGDMERSFLRNDTIQLQ